MRALSSGVAGTMHSMSRAAGSVWGRGGYSESGFLDQEEETEQKSQRRGSSSQGQVKGHSLPSAASPQQSEASTQPNPLDQAATIRAQLEEELKKEQVSRSSPTLRPRSETAGTIGSDDNSGDKARKSKSHREHRKNKKGSPDLLFAVPSPGFPDAPPQADHDLSPQRAPAAPAAGVTGDPWQSSPAEVVAAKSSPKPAFGGIWDPTPNAFAWPQKSASTSPAPAPPSPPASAAAAANSLAAGFAAAGVADGFRWGAEDSPHGDLPSNVEAPEKMLDSTPRKPLYASETEAHVETAPGMFDDAILAALAALPQQALVGVLRRLAQRRPAEVALALRTSTSAHDSETVSAPAPLPAPVLTAVPLPVPEPSPTPPAQASVTSPVPTPAPEPAQAPVPAHAPAEPESVPATEDQKCALLEIAEEIAAEEIATSGNPNDADADAAIAAATPEIAVFEAPSAPEETSTDRAANVSEVPIVASSSLVPNTSSQSLASSAMSSVASSDATSPALASATAAAPCLVEPVPPVVSGDAWAVDGNLWPPGPPSAASATNVTNPWPAPPANSLPQQAASLWPDPVEAPSASTTQTWPTTGDAAASPWPSAAPGSEWPAPTTGAKTEWPAF